MGRKAMMKNFIVLLVTAFVLTACSTVNREIVHMGDTNGGCDYYDSGLASWYGNEMAKGKDKNGNYIFNPTASGERFIPEGITAAHRTLPFGSKVRVVLDKPNADPNGIVVKINDRGPFVRGRIIDLSRGASRALKMPDTQRVKLYLCK